MSRDRKMERDANRLTYLQRGIKYFQLKNHRFKHLGRLGSQVKGISEGILENMALIAYFRDGQGRGQNHNL